MNQNQKNVEQDMNVSIFDEQTANDKDSNLKEMSFMDNSE